VGRGLRREAEIERRGLRMGSRMVSGPAAITTGSSCSLEAGAL